MALRLSEGLGLSRNEPADDSLGMLQLRFQQCRVHREQAELCGEPPDMANYRLGAGMALAWYTPHIFRWLAEAPRQQRLGSVGTRRRLLAYAPAFGAHWPTELSSLQVNLAVIQLLRLQTCWCVLAGTRALLKEEWDKVKLESEHGPLSGRA